MSFWNNAAEKIEQAEKDNQGTFEVLPAGDYTAVITDAAMKDTKAGNGKYVNLKLEITGPTHKGRVLFEMLHLFNPSDQAVAIAVGTLHKICTAVNNEQFYEVMKTTCTTPQKAEEYLSAGNIWGAIGNRPLTVKLAIKNDGQYGDKNIIKAWKPGGDVIAPVSAPASKKPF